MHITKQYKKLINKLEDFFKVIPLHVNVYILGATSLIIQNVIDRKTNDIDISILEYDEFAKRNLKEYIQKEINMDACVFWENKLDMHVKGYTWVLPKSALKRAHEIYSSKWVNMFVLDPLDILILKSERFDEDDESDIKKILKEKKPSITDIERAAKEYLVLLDAEPHVKDEIEEIIKGNLTIIFLIAKKLGCKK